MDFELYHAALSYMEQHPVVIDGLVLGGILLFGYLISVGLLLWHKNYTEGMDDSLREADALWESGDDIVRDADGMDDRV